VFFPFLDEHFPELAPHYREQYRKSAYLDHGYKDMLRARIGRIRDRYGLAAGRIAYEPELKPEYEQATLFPLQ
jgi:hypothetical protein